MFILILALIVLFTVLDASISSFILLMIAYATGLGVTLTLSGNIRRKGRNIFYIIFAVYIVTAYITSLSFSTLDHFLVSDSSRYIDSYINRIHFFYNKQDFIDCYFHFADNNLLYNAYLNTMAMFVNNDLGGMTVYGMTLLQTVWGVLSAIVLFRILSRHFEVEKAFHYTLTFALCSLFLFYSTVVIRDIVICFLYLCAFDVVDQKFSLTGLVKLGVIMILVWGIRLYSGIFVATFIGYYLYVQCRTSSLKSIATFLFAIVLIFAAGSILASSLMEQTIAELEGYEELSAERSAGGMVSKLQSLPPGISHFAIVLFTMVRPLPPFAIYSGAQTFSHIVMSSMCLIAVFFWFVVFYSLCCQLFLKKYVFKMPFEQAVMLLVCLVFMLANASHPDIRRMLPVFPILFVQFAEICEAEKVKLFDSKISKCLMSFYVMMAFGMLAIM